MYPPIFLVCSQVTAVTDLIGDSPVRLYPFGEAPENPALPYCVWQTVSGVPENYLGEVPDIDQWDIQIDCYASTGAGARNLAEALRDAIEPNAHITRWGGGSKEPDTDLFKYSFDVDWWASR